jgi:hypothetical protein
MRIRSLPWVKPLADTYYYRPRTNQQLVDDEILKLSDTCVFRSAALNSKRESMQLFCISRYAALLSWRTCARNWYFPADI